MSLEKVRSYLQEYANLKSIQALLHWDMETMMPAGAIEDRARRLSFVQGKLHSHITSARYAKLLRELRAQKLKPLEKKLLRELEYDFELNKLFPLKHVLELSEAQALASHAWGEARKKNDWAAFLPHLKKLIELKKREAEYFRTKRPYDALIKLHDREFTSDEIGQLFAELRTGLLKLSGKVREDGRFVKVKDLKGPFSIDAQRELSLKVARLFGLPEANSRLDVSNHPFSINISPRDQRITTRYETGHLDSLSSTMHEVGHALYELNLPQEWEGTPLQEAVSLSVHESQSRFWENVIGRSAEFCEFIHPEMAQAFPRAMKGIDPETLYRIFNKSVPGLIRVESSELYYNFHIIIRYEIEELIFNQGLPAEDIPAVWNKKYQEYLGIKPKTHAEGVLQDSHWAGGAFGYFPTYTLGNLISGTLFQQVKKEIPGFAGKIRKGEFAPILKWLKTNIHQKGRAVTGQDLVGKLGTKDYLKYLEGKFNV
jgi:carboxypeptidase Taq